MVMVIIMVMVIVIAMTVPLHTHRPADLEAHGGPGHLGGVVPSVHSNIANLLASPEPCPVPGREADAGGQKAGDVCSLQGPHGSLGHQDVLLMIVVDTQKLTLVLETPLKFIF